jgi:prepilin-type N-terminal cleavage/methylation domain-containing protein
MRFRNAKSLEGRVAYTLIELLVVIAIIAVLMGLLMSGVMAVTQAKTRSGNMYDLGKMNEAVGAATQKYGNCKTLPGQIVLYNNIDKYRNPTKYGIQPGTYEYVVNQRSRDVLRRMFGSRFVTNATTVNWDGSSPLNDNPILLEGQQCLVFYLGGMPQAATAGNAYRMIGFSPNPLDPTAAPVAGEERIGSFYEFESNRLVPMATRTFAPTANNPCLTLANGPQFLAYQDRYGIPYAYFGGTGGSNTYVSFCPSLPCPNNPPQATPTATNAGGPLAYKEVFSPARWTRPDTWQIISAGKDKQFGLGGTAFPAGANAPPNPADLWDPTKGSTDGYARDDQSSFSSTALGAPQN